MCCFNPHAVRSQGDKCYLTEVCVGPRAGIDIVKKRKINYFTIGSETQFLFAVPRLSTQLFLLQYRTHIVRIRSLPTCIYCIRALCPIFARDGFRALFT
jgi:hypothetical protein